MQRTESNGSRKPAAPAIVVHPSDEAAEAAVLSAVMLRASVLDTVRDMLVPEDFFAFQHRAVYEAILALDEASRAFDVVTVRHQLESTGRLKALGGAAFLATLTDATPAIANVLDHARLVHGLGRLRRMRETLERLAGASKLGETRHDVEGFLEHCEREVFTANAAESERDTGSGIAEMMATTVRQLTTPAQQGSPGVTTGLASLNELTLGFLPGELWYVAGRPGMGKTSLALGFAESVASTGRGVVVFSMEMTRPELSNRLIAGHAGINAKHLTLGKLDAGQMDDALAAANRLAKYPLRVDDDRSLTPTKLRSRLRRHVAAIRAQTPLAHLALVVVDYVQLMGVDRRTSNRQEVIEEISRELKILAGDFKCTVVALSQLTKPDPKTPHARPTSSELRGSGALWQDADKVLMIHRAPDGEQGAGGDAELILDKGRNTGRGKVVVTWVPWCARFEDRPQGSLPYAGVDDGPPLYDDES